MHSERHLLEDPKGDRSLPQSKLSVRLTSGMLLGETWQNEGDVVELEQGRAEQLIAVGHAAMADGPPANAASRRARTERAEARP